jgi:hypothetical protein
MSAEGIAWTDSRDIVYMEMSFLDRLAMVSLLARYSEKSFFQDFADTY